MNSKKGNIYLNCHARKCIGVFSSHSLGKVGECGVVPECEQRLGDEVCGQPTGIAASGWGVPWRAPTGGTSGARWGTGCDGSYTGQNFLKPPATGWKFQGY